MKWVPKVQNKENNEVPYFDPLTNLTNFFFSSLVRVSLRPLVKGVPKPHAMICLATDNDYKQWLLHSDTFLLKENQENVLFLS